MAESHSHLPQELSTQLYLVLAKEHYSWGAWGQRSSAPGWASGGLWGQGAKAFLF